MTYSEAAKKMKDIMDALDRTIAELQKDPAEGNERKIGICLGYREAVDMAMWTLEEKC